MGFDLNERYEGIAQRRLKELEGFFSRDRHPPGGALKALSK